MLQLSGDIIWISKGNICSNISDVISNLGKPSSHDGFECCVGLPTLLSLINMIFL